MRKVTLALLAVASAYATQLTYISNTADANTLETLSAKYKQKLLVNENRVYIIPSDCRLDRYFGGASEVEVKLAARPEQTEDIVITQKVFEAQSEEVIKEEIEVQKSIALVEGKVSKEFLMDKDGRGFGGASELPLDYSFQQVQVQQVYEKPVTVTQEPVVVQEKKEVKKVEPYTHPSCNLSADGSGYTLENTKNARFYTNGSFEDIQTININF